MSDTKINMNQKYRKLLSPMLNAIKQVEPDITPIAIYLRGSRMRHIETPDSDFDIVALVPSTGRELLSNKATHETFQTPMKANGKIYTLDVQVWSIKQLYQHIANSDINTLELLLNKPLFFNRTQLNNSQLRYYLLLEELIGMRHKLIYYAFIKFYYAAQSLIDKYKAIKNIDDLKVAGCYFEYTKRIKKLVENGDIDELNWLTYLNGTPVSYLKQMDNGELENFAQNLAREISDFKDIVTNWQRKYKFAKRDFMQTVNYSFTKCYQQNEISFAQVDDNLIESEATDLFGDSIEIIKDHEIYKSSEPLDAIIFDSNPDEKRYKHNLNLAKLIIKNSYVELDEQNLLTCTNINELVQVISNIQKAIWSLSILKDFEKEQEQNKSND